MKKLRIIITCTAFLGILLGVTLYALPAAGFASDGVNQVSVTGCLPGDIIILGTPDTFFDYLIPGDYSHTEIYCGKVQAGELIWDRDNHCWMAEGTDYVIHSTKSDEEGNGLGYSTWQVGVNNHAENVLILRVNKASGAALTATDRANIVNFLKAQLTGGVDGYPVGPEYDWNWLGQQMLGSDEGAFPAYIHGYYCSEAAWGAYKYVLGIDLDSDTATLDIGVSPDDLWHSQYTSVVAGEKGDTTWSADVGIYKLTVFIDEMYYDDDYDPWPSGAGEEYLKAFCGDGITPTEQGYPGDGKIGHYSDTSPSYWTRDGSGAIDCNRYCYSYVNYGRDLKVRIEAWEEDPSPNGDDQYPVFQWYWNPIGWHGYINNGWYTSGSRVDLGDCRYTIKFRIDAVTF
ncbi:MAG: hypothetical protein RBG13Loki_3139 [Promethearchaeota archaeon CR_4]|nr:MAG: hypothetical protein RBG13Loki_3139 [Candidatus Lokiarchaeota archaeon CR_4]